MDLLIFGSMQSALLIAFVYCVARHLNVFGRIGAIFKSLKQFIARKPKGITVSGMSAKTSVKRGEKSIQFMLVIYAILLAVFYASIDFISAEVKGAKIDNYKVTFLVVDTLIITYLCLFSPISRNFLIRLKIHIEEFRERIL